MDDGGQSHRPTRTISTRAGQGGATASTTSSARNAMRREASERVRSCRSKRLAPTGTGSTCGRPRRRSRTTRLPTATPGTSRDSARPTATWPCRSTASGFAPPTCTTVRSLRLQELLEAPTAAPVEFLPRLRRVRSALASDSSPTARRRTRFGCLYDTRLPGNSNAGHLYGVDLTAAQKKALIEFLKTL